MDLIKRTHPELREVLLQLPEFYLPEDLERIRKNQPPEPRRSDKVKIHERKIEGKDGHEMIVRIYEPAEQNGEAKRPALLWIHGGGYIMGHPSHDDDLLQEIVETVGCVVFSPDYRLAPEHPFPAGLEDCYSTLLWISQSYEEFKIELSRLAIGGASAGGGMTVALALLARDRKGPKICFQMPLYPMIDDRNMTPSSHEITHPAVWNRRNNLAAWSMYLGDGNREDVSPYAAPIRADNLADLPPTYTCVGQLDPFRDETIEYVMRLAQAGVEVEFHLYPGGYHAFEIAAPDAPISRKARSEYIGALSRALQS